MYRNLISKIGILGIAIICCGCSYDAARFDSRLRAAVFDRYWGALDRDYPFFKRTGVDWKALREEYRPQAIHAASRSEFYACLAKMLGSLNDAHIHLGVTAEDLCDYNAKCGVAGMRLLPTGKQLFVVKWSQGATPPVPQQFRNYPHVYPELVSVEGVSQISLIGVLVVGSVGSECELALRWPDGTTTTHLVSRECISPHGPTDDEPGDQAPATTSRPRRKLLLAHRLSAETAFIRLPTLDYDSLGLTYQEATQQFDEALNELEATSGLVVDLQGNIGGSYEFAVAIASRFCRMRQVAYYRHTKFLNIWPSVERLYIEPRQPRYEGKVVVLVDGLTMSSAEWLAELLRRTAGATLIGETTCGAVAFVTEVDGPDGTELVFGRDRLTDEEGRDFQFIGLDPDMSIPLTLDALLSKGYLQAARDTARSRFKKALEVLAADPSLELEHYPVKTITTTSLGQ